MKRICLIAILSFNFAHAQYLLDVKTSLQEKCDLVLPKAALIANLNMSSWAKVVEFGEQYSIWLTNYETASNEEHTIMELRITIEIRKPSATFRNELLRTIEIDEVIDIPAELIKEGYDEQGFARYFNKITDILTIDKAFAKLFNLATSPTAKLALDNLASYPISQFITVAQKTSQLTSGKDITKCTIPNYMAHESVVIGDKIYYALKSVFNPNGNNRP